MQPDIFEWVKEEEARFENEEIQVGQNWNWNFRNHVQMIFHLKNGQFFKGENNYIRAFKNIMEPMLELCDWMEDIELKDVVFFIENQTGRVLSFLIKKYHDEVFSKKHDLDMMIDEITESDNSYGGVLVQKTNTVKPEVLPLTSIAFCDQTDILGGPIAFKHTFSPDALREKTKIGWGDTKNGATITIEELITLATTSKTPAGGVKANTTTGKNIEVYIIKGCLPEHYLKDNDNIDDYYDQLQIVAFYTDKDSKKQGVVLYRAKNTGKLLFHTSKKVDNRALGRGNGERMIHPQIWTNFLEIHKMGLLESASKVTLFTDDDTFTNKSKVQEMDNLEIAKISTESKWGVRQIPTAAPTNIALFENGINEWYQHAQLTSSAFDPVLGEEPNSGTTFRGQNQIVQQGKGSHNKRRGQRAKFIEQIYREMIIHQMVKEILSGKEFLATLTSDELTWVSDQLATNYAYRSEIDMVLNGELPPTGITFEQLREENKLKFLKDFSKKGNKHLLGILKGEFKDVEVKMGINVAGKQKNLADMSDKLLSIIQFAFSNPQNFLQTLQIPGMAKNFNDIMEYGGLSPVDFAIIGALPAPQTVQ